MYQYFKLHVCIILVCSYVFVIFGDNDKAGNELAINCIDNHWPCIPDHSLYNCIDVTLSYSSCGGDASSRGVINPLRLSRSVRWRLVTIVTNTTRCNMFE